MIHNRLKKKLCQTCKLQLAELSSSDDEMLLFHARSSSGSANQPSSSSSSSSSSSALSSSSSFIHTNNSHIEFITTAAPHAYQKPPLTTDKKKYLNMRGENPSSNGVFITDKSIQEEDLSVEERSGGGVEEDVVAKTTVIKWVDYSTNSTSIIREAHVYRYMQLNWPEDPMSSLVEDITFDKRKGFEHRCGFVMRAAIGDLGHYICCDKMKADVASSGRGAEQTSSLIRPDYLLMSILLSLFRLHEGGIVHRDVKPGNILIDRPRAQGAPPTIIVADFGNSSVVRGFDLMRRKYTSETCTRVYAPPEDAWGTPLEYSFDIWCAAATVIHYMRYRCYVNNLHLGDPATFETIARNNHSELAVPFYDQHRAMVFADMLQSMVHPDPQCRPTAQSLLLDVFFQETCCVAGMPSTHIMMGFERENNIIFRKRSLFVGPPPFYNTSQTEERGGGSCTSTHPPPPIRHEHGYASLLLLAQQPDFIPSADARGEEEVLNRSPIENLVHYVATQLGSRPITYRTVLYMLHWIGESGMCNAMKNIISGVSGNVSNNGKRKHYYITKKQGQIVTACFMVVYMCTEEEILNEDVAVGAVCEFILHYLPEGTYKTPVYKAFSAKTLHSLAKHIFFTQFQCIVPLQYVDQATS